VRILARDQRTAIALAVDAKNAYWTTDDGFVRSVPFAGGEVKTLASGQGELFGMVLAGTHLYWTSYSQGTIVRMSVDGGATTTLATGQDRPMRIAADCSDVYWTNVGGQVMRAAR
jgi:hypothetical protein